MNIREIVLVCISSRPQALQMAKELETLLHARTIHYETLTDYKQLPLHQDVDLCISLGGDGTTLRCARQCAPLHIPILPVNCGSLGFLSACEAEEASACLTRILDGDFQISSRLLLEADILRHNKECLKGLLAFNDCVIKTFQPRAFTLRAERAGGEFKHFYGDGVIVSTPAGSTAYSLAAGGPIVEPDLDVLLITPICPHTLAERTLLLHADEELILSPQFKHPADQAAVSLDGQDNYELQNGDRVILRRAACRAQLVCAGEFDFFGQLRHKLEWGKSRAEKTFR